MSEVKIWETLVTWPNGEVGYDLYATRAGAVMGGVNAIIHWLADDVKNGHISKREAFTILQFIQNKDWHAAINTYNILMENKSSSSHIDIKDYSLYSSPPAPKDSQIEDVRDEIVDFCGDDVEDETQDDE